MSRRRRRVIMERNVSNLMKGLSEYFENHFEIKGLFAKNSIIVKMNFSDIDIVVEVRT